MTEFAVWLLFFLAAGAAAFNPLAKGPACGEALTEDEERLLDEGDSL